MARWSGTDPDDGRASLLLPTELDGPATLTTSPAATRTTEPCSPILTTERAEFARYLARFTAAFDAYKPAILAEVMSAHEIATTRRENR
jgi:hypothetical protein